MILEQLELEMQTRLQKQESSDKSSVYANLRPTYMLSRPPPFFDKLNQMSCSFPAIHTQETMHLRQLTVVKTQLAPVGGPARDLAQCRAAVPIVPGQDA